MGERREHHLVGAGCQGDAGVQHAVEELRVSTERHRRPRPLKIERQFRPEEQADERPDPRHPRLHTGVGKRPAQPFGEAFRRPLELLVGIDGQQIQHCEPGGGGQRVTGQRTGLVHRPEGEI